MIGRATQAIGRRGAVATAHPSATRAAISVLAEGGSAVDAAIAAHLVLAVVAPQATGLGGDLLALVGNDAESPDGPGPVVSFGGAGRTAEVLPVDPASAGASVTVPGMIGACGDLHTRYGRLPWDRLFDDAIDLAASGIVVDATLYSAVEAQRSRLSVHARGYELTTLAQGELWTQPELGSLLTRISRDGTAAFYSAEADAVSRAVMAAGGALWPHDLAQHETMIGEAIEVTGAGVSLSVQPAPTQGVLLAMAWRWVLENRDRFSPEVLDHLLIEAAGAAFEFRDDAHRGASLLDEPLVVSPDRAARRGGPRAYLHTAGVATADSTGLVVSSLSSVFDDFGSGILVSELGIVLNNRAEGFTRGANAYAAGARPVHTLAPAMLRTAEGLIGIATPGADGQVQTLLAVLARTLLFGEANGSPFGPEFVAAVARPRWRAQDARVLVEARYPEAELAPLLERGHDMVPRPDGIDAFGAVVAAGYRDDQTMAVADWRRQTTAGAVQ